MNDRVTDWFDINTGVQQGDSLSPSLFSIFINDPAQEVKDMNAGLMVVDVNLPILLYADDIVLISPTPEKLQSMLDVAGNWCRKWGMQVNAKKHRSYMREILKDQEAHLNLDVVRQP